MAAVLNNFRIPAYLARPSSNPGRLANDILMYRETDRLRSFKNWPLNFIEPRTLARAGFYYTNNGDLVRCPFCKIDIMKWKPGDNAMAEHQRWSQSCPFVCGLYCGNVPISSDSVGIVPQTCNKQRLPGVEIRPHSYLERNCRQASCSADQVKGLRYPEYASFENRIRSFLGWPPSVKQKPDELAAAGFFYNGKKDETVCFHCGLGLKNWASDDNPWEQHIRWTSKCGYVRSQKSADYIKEVCSKQSAVLTPEEIAALRVSCAANSNNSESPKATCSNMTSPGDRVRTCNAASFDTKQKNALCKICHYAKKNVMFLPCRHTVVCSDCAPALNTCIICHKPLKATVKVSVTIS